MAQVLTAVSLVALAGYLVWRFADRLHYDRIRITLALDRSSPGAHLIWTIGNGGAETITLAKLVAHTRQGLTDLAARGLPQAVEPQGETHVATDVDWNLLTARSIAVIDADGREHAASHRQLQAIQDRLRELIDRRTSAASARDFLTGAADLAFGVVILGLGFFMLMWVIATG